MRDTRWTWGHLVEMASDRYQWRSLDKDAPRGVTKKLTINYCYPTCASIETLLICLPV